MLITNDQALKFLSVAQKIEEPEYRAVPLTLDFTATNQYTLILQNMQARDFINTIRALWVDNTINGSILFINFPVTGQTIQVPPGEQGYLNVLCPNPAQMNFTSVGNVAGVQVTLLNYPVTDALWSQSGTIVQVQGVLTNAQIKTMFSAPTLLIPAQGAGTVIRIISSVFENLNQGVAYTLGGAFQPCWGTSLADSATQAIVATFLTTPTVNQITFPNANGIGGSANNAPSSAIVNAPIFIVAATQDFATGIGTMKYSLTYQVLLGF